MTSYFVNPAERRRAFRFAIQQQSRLRVTLEGPSDGDEINAVTLTDISQQGLMTAGAGHLVPGAHISVEVPLVGWREVEVMWIADNRAGCRFIKPLNFDELRLAAASSERLALECPSLASDIAALVPIAESVEEPERVEQRPVPTPNGWIVPSAILAFLSLAAAAFLLVY